MKSKLLRTLWKGIRIGFKKRITICYLLLVSIAVFVSFSNPLVKLAATFSAIITADFMVYCYVPFYVDQLSFLLRFRNKAIELPLPNEISALAKRMNVKIEKMKILPKICNAFALGNQFFIGEDLIKKLDSEEIIGVSAHEFEHIRGKHSIIKVLYILPIVAFFLAFWQNVPSTHDGFRSFCLPYYRSNTY